MHYHLSADIIQSPALAVKEEDFAPVWHLTIQLVILYGNVGTHQFLISMAHGGIRSQVHHHLPRFANVLSEHPIVVHHLLHSRDDVLLEVDIGNVELAEVHHLDIIVAVLKYLQSGLSYEYPTDQVFAIPYAPRLPAEGLEDAVGILVDGSPAIAAGEDADGHVLRTFHRLPQNGHDLRVLLPCFHQAFRIDSLLPVQESLYQTIRCTFSNIVQNAHRILIHHGCVHIGESQSEVFHHQSPLPELLHSICNQQSLVAPSYSFVLQLLGFSLIACQNVEVVFLERVHPSQVRVSHSKCLLFVLCLGSKTSRHCQHKAGNGTCQDRCLRYRQLKGLVHLLALLVDEAPPLSLVRNTIRIHTLVVNLHLPTGELALAATGCDECPQFRHAPHLPLGEADHVVVCRVEAAHVPRAPHDGVRDHLHGLHHPHDLLLVEISRAERRVRLRHSHHLQLLGIVHAQLQVLFGQLFHLLTRVAARDH